MRAFWRFLLRKNLPADSLSGVSFAAFGLGDSGDRIPRISPNAATRPDFICVRMAAMMSYLILSETVLARRFHALSG